MNSLQIALERLERSLAERGQSHFLKPCRGIDSEGKQIPLAINRLATTSPRPLFASHSTQQRPYLHAVTILLPNHDTALYCGPQLANDDRAVWRQLINWSHTLEHEPLDFSALTFLKALGWGNSYRDRIRLRTCLERLQASALQFGGENGETVTQSLLTRCERRASPAGHSERWRIWLDKSTVKWFTTSKSTGFSRPEVEQTLQAA